MKSNNSIINTKGLDITKPNQFADIVAQAKDLQGQLEAFWGAVEQQMLEKGISNLKGDFGSISVAERKTWKATKQLPPRYYKQVLDTSKLNFLFKAGEKLPEGAEYSTSQYITKRLK
jgi:hypothetical protein